MDNVYNALTVLIIAGTFLIFTLGILVLAYARKIKNLNIGKRLERVDM